MAKQAAAKTRVSRKKERAYTEDTARPSDVWVEQHAVQRSEFKCKTPAQGVYLNAMRSKRIVFGVGPAGTGKAQPLDCKVATPTGWSRMGDLKIGDLITVPDGTAAPVTAIYPQGEKDVWKITFEDGRSTECCDEHLWKVHRYDWMPEKNRQRVVPLSEIRRMLDLPSAADRLYVDLCAPQQRPDIDLPIDPYLLGALLGNGCFQKSCVLFSTGDDFTLEKVSGLLPEGLYLRKMTSNPYDYAIVKKDSSRDQAKNELLESLRELNLSELHSYMKFIPAPYLSASPDQIYQLLQGLMDTDGTVDKNTSSVSYCSTSFLLASQVQFLVRSLGGLAKISRKIPTYTHLGEKRIGRLAYTVNIRLKDASKIISLPRKLARLSSDYQYRDCLRLRIKQVEYAGRKEAQCITVDHHEHLYMTDDFIVTHNTFVAVSHFAKQLRDRNVNRLVFIRPAVEAEEKIGFLPGELEEKIEPFFMPIREILEEWFGRSTVEAMIKRKTIEVASLGHARGRTFANAMVLLDEAQNTTARQMKLFLTRLGENSTFVVNGDIEQKDIKEHSGLEDAVVRMRDLPDSEICTFEDKDSVRDPMLFEILKRYRY